MIKPEKQIKIKVLKEIPTKISSVKPLIKAFETYSYLKYYYTNGIITNCTRNQHSIAKMCNISVRTLWTRIQLMKDFKLATVINGNITLAKWDTVCEKFSIRKRFYYIKINNDNENNCKLEYIIKLKALQEAKKRMQTAFKFKVKESSILYNEFCRITGAEDGKLSRRAVLNNAINCFQNPSAYTLDQQYFLLNSFNSDDNLNCRTIANMFNNFSASSGTYLKKILEKHGFITIEKRIYESVQRCREAIMGTVYYSRPTKNTILIMPDNLIINGL